MYEKEIEAIIKGATPSEAYNTWTSSGREPANYKEARDRAAVFSALGSVKNNSFWRAILEAEKAEKCVKKA